jgi:hypothetical protein
MFIHSVILLFTPKSKIMKKKLISILMISMISFVACKKEDIVPALPPVTEVTYSSVDSVKLDSFYLRNGEQNLITQVNNKQYTVKNNSASAKYFLINGNFDIDFADTAANGLVNELAFRIKNKTFENIAGTYSFNPANVELTWSQILENRSAGFFGTRSLSPDVGILSGTITIQTDFTNKTITGKIERLRYPFGEYIPLYQNGFRPHVSIYFSMINGGSTRNQEITFKNVKKG